MKRLWRYARQIQVIGEPAQHALLRARVSIDPAMTSFAASVEALYLAAAGVGTLEVPHERRDLEPLVTALNGAIQVTHGMARTSDIPRLLSADGDGGAAPIQAVFPALSDEHARSALEGALAALAAMRGIVGPVS